MFFHYLYVRVADGEVEEFPSISLSMHEFPFCGSFKSGKCGRKVWGNDATGGINSRDMGASGRSDR